MAEELLPVSTFTHSASIGALAEALAKAQGSFKPVLKEANNPFFKSRYADLSSMISATKDALSKSGLVIIQSPGRIANGQVELTSLLAHSSGEWIRAETSMPTAKSDAQGIGSATTYARRYAYQSLLNIAGEEDDDANAASGKTAAESKAERKHLDEKLGDRVNQSQIAAMLEAMKRTGKTQAQVSALLGEMGYVQFGDVGKGDFQSVLKWLNSSPKGASAGDLKAIFAAAHSKGIPEADVKRWAYEAFSVSSMTELTPDQCLKVAEWVAGL